MASLRLKAVAVGTARAASMYLVGNPGAAHYVRPLRPFYDPSDPASGHNTVRPSPASPSALYPVMGIYACYP